MKREHFLEAARTLSTDYGLSIIDCLRRKEWVTATDVADDLSIHVSTASKDLSSLFECGFLERKKSKRKTRPAYEYKLKADRIVLELDVDQPETDSREEVAASYISFLERLFMKARRMGWQSLESAVVREFGDGNESFTDIAIRELTPASKSSSLSEVRSVFTLFLDRIRRVFVANIGEVATARIFQAAAKETAEAHPAIRNESKVLADMGVREIG